MSACTSPSTPPRPGDVEVEPVESELGAAGVGARRSVMKPPGMRTIASRSSCAACSGVMRGSMGSAARPRRARSGPTGRSSRPGGERGERRLRVVRVDGLLVVGGGIHPDRGHEHEVVGVVGAQHALAVRVDHARRDAGLGRAPGEPAVALVVGVDRRLVDEQRHRLHRHVRRGDHDERGVTGARRRERGRPRRADRTVLGAEHRVDVRGVRRRRPRSPRRSRTAHATRP